MDKKYRAISDKYNVRLGYIDVTEAVNEICKLQGTNIYSSTALSKIIIDTTLISLALKDDDIVNVSYVGKGLMGTIVAEYQNNFIRGYADYPSFDKELFDDKLEIDELSQAIGVNGVIQVSRKKEGKEPFVSNVELMSNSVDLNFMYYMSKSDQIKSFICSSVLVNKDESIKKARGIFIQLLPEFSEEKIDELEEHIGTISDLEDLLLNEDNPESILKKICNDVNVLSVEDLTFKCTCSLEKALSSVKLLGDEDVNEIKTKGENVEIICDFCKTKYDIKANEI